LRFQKLKEQPVAQSNGIAEDLNKSLKDATIIIENSEKITQIIRNVMQKCANELMYTVQEINLSLLLKEELRFLESDMAFKHSIEKVYDLKDVIPSIYGVYSHFSHSFLQILENCKNAMKTADLKQLTVSLDYHEKNIAVMFHDTGCGIEPRKKEAILTFLNSTTSDNSRHPEITGGLYHVKMLLQNYNPIFKITSCPGDTTFAIHFPVH
jgi:signal transduction histidine kinase